MPDSTARSADSEPATAAADELCGACEVLSAHFGEEGVQFYCELPAGHDGWHADRSETDEYRWAPS